MGIVKVSMDEMRNELKKVIDDIGETDAVSFSINWVKDAGTKEFCSSVVIEIDKDIEEDFID